MSSGWRGRSPRWARRSPGTSAPCRAPSAAGARAFAPRCRVRAAPARASRCPGCTAAGGSPAPPSPARAHAAARAQAAATVFGPAGHEPAAVAHALEPQPLVLAGKRPASRSSTSRAGDRRAHRRRAVGLQPQLHLGAETFDVLGNSPVDLRVFGAGGTRHSARTPSSASVRTTPPARSQARCASRFAQRQHVVVGWRSRGKSMRIASKAVHSAARRRSAQRVELVPVVLAQFLHARVQAAEDALVRRQHQRVGLAAVEPVERIEPQRSGLPSGSMER
jgi:hypothetical protein